MPESHDTARCRSISRRYAGLDLSAASITVNGTERTWCCVLSGLAAHTAGLAHVRCKAQEIRGAGTCTAYSVRGGSRPHRTCLCFLGCWFAASSQGQLCNAFVGFDDHRLGPRLSLLPGQPACKPNVLVVACRCACSSQVSTHHANNKFGCIIHSSAWPPVPFSSVLNMKPCRGPENELQATKSSLSTAELVASSDGGGPSGGGMLVAGAARIQVPLRQPRIAVWSRQL